MMPAVLMTEVLTDVLTTKVLANVLTTEALTDVLTTKVLANVLTTDALTAAAWLLSARWLLACVGSVAVGLLAWLLLNGAAQIWPALRTRRAVWLAAQIVVAAAALLPFLPRGAQIGAAPQIMLAPVVLAVSAPITPHDDSPLAAPPRAHNNFSAALDGGDTATALIDGNAPNALAGGNAPAALAGGDAAPAGAHMPVAPDTFAPAGSAIMLPLLAGLWLLAYAAGLAWAAARLLRALRTWRGLLASANRLSVTELQGHAAFSAAQLREIARHKLTVMRTEASVSPMLIGVRRPVLLLPTQLDALSTEQQHMVIAHELHHWRVRDPLCLAAAALLQTVFWFNPALRWMAKQMAWALELECDQHVLAGRTQQQRKQYAASLLQPWATTMGVAAFNGATIAARIRHMQKSSLPALSGVAAWTTGAALTALLAAGVTLQPALAFSVPASAATPPPVIQPTAATEPPAEAWRAPLDKIRVNSFFGVKRSIPRTPHKGIDFGAAKGTPVHATASGTVIAAGPIAENDGKYGNTVIIDHGAQRSLYAHLNSVSVRPGQQVQAGQLIGAVGETGLATGPHLHLEVRQNGQNIDPATMLTNLDAYATPHALKVRRQQLPSKG